MNCIEKLKSKVIITWEMKAERLAILQNAVRDLDQAATEEQKIDLTIRRAAAELDYLLLEGWHDEFRARMDEVTEADPMEAEFQALRDDVGAGE